MILVTASAQCRPDAHDEMAAALAAAALTSRTDPGCLEYRFFEDVEDPTSFLSVERWDERSSLDAHMGTPHVAALLETLGGLVTGPPEIVVHDLAGSAPYGS